ncbi:MAG: hypothetical protein LC772_10370 [Chloroflexi bacterium]|nr:hypothetical protein [Chloroflexota bacterium]
MLQAFVITLRKGIEAALVVAIAPIYLRRMERQDLLRPRGGPIPPGACCTAAG